MVKSRPISGACAQSNIHMQRFSVTVENNGVRIMRKHKRVRIIGHTFSASVKIEGIRCFCGNARYCWEIGVVQNAYVHE